MVGEGAKPEEGGVEILDFWISQSCYMEEDPKCNVKGHQSVKQGGVDRNLFCINSKQFRNMLHHELQKTQMTVLLVFLDLGRCVSIPNEMPHGLTVEKTQRGAEYEHPVGGMVGLDQLFVEKQRMQAITR